ncbi:MAG: hypothetical protein JW726_09450 [Anaerolineales bacterium]|nr:hypothetical protein [Anaerolineales bacterium]
MSKENETQNPSTESPSPAEMADSAADATEGGMRTSQEELEILAALNSVSPVDEADSEDHGLHAASSVGEDSEIPPGVGLPVVEIPMPPAASTKGAPPITQDEILWIGPTAGMPGASAPSQPDALPADPAMVDMLVTKTRIQALWDRADEIIKVVNQRMYTLEIGRSLLDQIKYGRNELLAGRDHYEEAERHINEAEYRANQSSKSRRWSYTYGVPLFIYELIWGIVFTYFVIRYWPQMSQAGSTAGYYLLGSLVAGGFGGVLGALLALVKHISQEQDFDRQHTMWYLNSPVMASGIGVVIYLVMNAGLWSLTSSGSQSINQPAIIYVLAWLAGFQQNVFTSIVKRLIKVFEIEGQKEEAKVEKVKEPTQSIPPPPQGSEEGPSKRG